MHAIKYLVGKSNNIKGDMMKLISMKKIGREGKGIYFSRFHI